LAVWSDHGEAPLRGTVIKRGGSRAAVLVRWDTGREDKIKPQDEHVRFAYDGSRRLDWLLDPDVLRRQLKSDPDSVFVDVIRDEGKAIQTATIKRRLIELGIEPSVVETAFKRSQPSMKNNRHLVIKGASHTWSDVPVDPWATTRALDPHSALDRLLTTSRFKPGERDALADAVRSGLPPRPR